MRLKSTLTNNANPSAVGRGRGGEGAPDRRLRESRRKYGGVGEHIRLLVFVHLFYMRNGTIS